MTAETIEGGLQSRLAQAQEEAKTTPNDAASQSRLGWIFLGLKKFEEAKNTFESALLRWPDNIELNYALGLTFKNLDQRENQHC